MSDDLKKRVQDELRQKLLAARAHANPPKPTDRRKDYKGERARIFLRVPARLDRDLNILSVAMNLDKNALCLEGIERLVRERLALEREKRSEADWGAIVRLANGDTKKVDGD